MLRDALLRAGQGLYEARQQSITHHPLAAMFRHELPIEVTRALGETATQLRVDGSAGAGNWAHVPWVALFDPHVTTSATRGYYVVYLYHYDKPLLYLSLNQGTTAVVDEFGHRRGYEMLRDRANLMRARLASFERSFPTVNISLGSRNSLPRGYECGHALGKVYNLNSMPDEDALCYDLHQILKAYSTLTYRGGLGPSIESADHADSDTFANMTLDEMRRYRLHRVIERNATASRKVKAFHGVTCEACLFNFSAAYGDLGNGYIEAHHLKPLSALDEGSFVTYNIKDDFAVLCSNCHRMIHKTEDPSDLAGFKLLVRKQ